MGPILKGLYCIVILCRVLDKWLLFNFYNNKLFIQKAPYHIALLTHLNKIRSLLTMLINKTVSVILAS